MLNKIASLWKSSEGDLSSNPADCKAVFRLMYGKEEIATLTYEDNTWLFAYSEYFKDEKNLNTISDFPDRNKIYETKELWPFFKARIPALNQPYQFKKIEKANVDVENSVELLKLFGKKTIANPFKLVSLF